MQDEGGSDANEDENRGLPINALPLVQRLRHWLSTSMQYIGPRTSTLALFVSLGAFFVSSGALIISSLQYKAVTRHHRLSVKPHVNVIFYLEGALNQRNGIYIANPGLGPAIIKAVSVEMGGKSYSAVNKHTWRNVLHDLSIEPNCFKYRLLHPEGALKSGEEFELLTLTHANPPIVDGRHCQIELERLLMAEGLKVRIQYESMYGEPHERIVESPVDDIKLELSRARMHHVASKIVGQVQSMLPQFQQLVDRLQQMQVDTIKRMADLEGLMLLRELYEDPPGAPPGWWLQQRGSPVKPKD
jgi:hypothetical protein